MLPVVTKSEFFMSSSKAQKEKMSNSKEIMKTGRIVRAQCTFYKTFWFNIHLPYLQTIQLPPCIIGLKVCIFFLNKFSKLTDFLSWITWFLHCSLAIIQKSVFFSSLNLVYVFLGFPIFLFFRSMLHFARVHITYFFF